MALLTNEERALGVSEAFIADLRVRIDNFKAGIVSVLETPKLYKQRNARFSNFSETWYNCIVNHGKGQVQCERYVREHSGSVKTYRFVIEGTKTLSALDRVETELFKRIKKDTRNAWCETQLLASGTSATSLKKPMLLHKWDKYSGRMSYPCIVQPKIDGIRAIWDAKEGKLFSRSGKVIDLRHITRQLQGIPFDFDGELAFSDPKIPLPEVIHGIAHDDTSIYFHIFDNITDPDKPFYERFISELPEIFGYVNPLDNVVVVATQVMHTHNQVTEYYEMATQHGMEGVVVRRKDAIYEYGRRVDHTLKYKWEIEEKFPIVGYSSVPSAIGELIMFQCTHAGNYFEVVPAWTHEDRKKMHDDLMTRRIAISDLQQLLVEYRGLTPDNIPYHAVGKTPRVALIAK